MRRHTKSIFKIHHWNANNLKNCSGNKYDINNKTFLETQSIFQFHTLLCRKNMKKAEKSLKQCETEGK